MRHFDNMIVLGFIAIGIMGVYGCVDLIVEISSLDMPAIIESWTR